MKDDGLNCFLIVLPHIFYTDMVYEGDDAALLLPPLPPHYMVQTIDYFRSFVSDPYLFGQIAANHALSGTCIHTYVRYEVFSQHFGDCVAVDFCLSCCIIFLIMMLIERRWM